MALFGSKKDQKDTAKPAAKAAPAAKAPAAVKRAAAKQAEAAVSMKELYGAAAPKASKTSAAKAGAPTLKFASAYRQLIRPLITEKATHLGGQNKYVFVVAPDANKITIKKALETVYGVKATKINMIKLSGKRVVRGRIKGQRKDWKKAIVTLAKGESLQVYAGV